MQDPAHVLAACRREIAAATAALFEAHHASRALRDALATAAGDEIAAGKTFPALAQADVLAREIHRLLAGLPNHWLAHALVHTSATPGALRQQLADLLDPKTTPKGVPR